MNDTHALPDEKQLPERPAFLVLVALSPAIFITHFVLSYAWAAVWCARLGGGAEPSLAGARWPFIAVTAAALGGVAIIGWGGYTRHRHGSEAVPHDMDTPGDRHRFLGFSTVLLSALSAIGIVFVAVAFAAFETCR
jgi:hypothetical protein